MPRIDKTLDDLVSTMEDRGTKRTDIDPETLAMLEDFVKSEDASTPEKPAKGLPRSPGKRAEQSQLPLWPMATRGVPNAILRSALFGVIQAGRRSHCLDMEVPSAGGNLHVTYTGMRLDQADLDVWEQCLSMAKEKGLGERIEFQANEFLAAIGRGKSGSQHDWLKKSLKRLNGAQVEIREGDRAYFGTLIYDGFRDEKTKRYVIQLNPKLSKLYGQHHWTRVQWDERHALGKKHLAQWLHGFYSSHKNPHPIKVETLRWLCGSDTQELSKFRQSLKTALVHLQAVTEWKCWVDNTDKVRVVRHSK